MFSGKSAGVARGSPTIDVPRPATIGPIRGGGLATNPELLCMPVPDVVRRARRWGRTRLRFWKDFYLTGERELRELPRYVRRDAMAIDIGGNIGIYTYHLHRLAARVVTFEPNPDYVGQIRALGLKRDRVEPIALSNASGEVTLRIPRLASGRVDVGMATIEPGVVGDDAVARAITVQTRRLDDYGFDGVGFVKIDVEGHEEAVLDGAAETIARNRPALLIEIEERHNRGGPRRIADKLASQGYSGFFFRDGGRRPMAEFVAERDQQDRPELLDAGHERRRNPYINNFVFLPEGGTGRTA